ncbi:MAG: hypothetical protein J6C33_02090 [Lachnospiraceae bacterium]|nr:hypothetical protein [Lachnospiraceae bacterium]
MRKRKRRRRSSFRQKLKAVFSCLILLGILGFGVWHFSFEEIRLAEHVEIGYTGYDTKGTAYLRLKNTGSHSAFFDTVECSLLTENGTLANGDPITVHFSYDEELAEKKWLRVKDEDAVYTVSVLPEGTPLSTELLFRDVSVSFEGTPPALTLTVTNKSADPFLETVSYEITDAKDFYDMGDTFHIKAVFSEQDAVLSEYITTGREEDYTKEYTVETQERYLTDASLLTMDDIRTMNETAASLFSDANEYGLRIFSEANLMPEWTNGKTTFRWSNPRLISAYFNTLKPEHYGNGILHINDVKLVYLVTLSQANGAACEAEAVVRFNNLMQEPDGSLDLALDSAKLIAASYQNSHIVNLVNDEYHDEYESEKLELE